MAKPFKITQLWVNGEPVTGLDIRGEIEIDEPDPPVDPPPTTPSGIHVEERPERTLQGKRIWRFWAPGHHLTAGNSSGGYSYFSPGGRWLSLYKRHDQTRGKWYVADVRDWDDIWHATSRNTGPEGSGGDVHENLIWLGDDTYARLALVDGEPRLYRSTVEGVDMEFVDLPRELKGPNGSSLTMQWRTYIGSGRPNPALIATHGPLMAIWPFDSDTLEPLGRGYWWIGEAHQAGVDAGTALEPVPTRLHNPVTMGSGGYAGGPAVAETQQVHHYYRPQTAVQIEPHREDGANVLSHQAYRWNYELVGVLADASTRFSVWSPSRSDRSTLWTMPKTRELMDCFPGQSNPNAIAYHHGDIGIDWAVSTQLDWQSPNENRYTTLVKHRISDGHTIPIVKGIRYNGDATGVDRDVHFLRTPRPSIAATDDLACYMEEVDGFVNVFVVEL